MAYRFKTSLLIGAAVAGLGATAPAWGQDAKNDSSVTGDIIVTARRTEERLQDVPISITVFNQQQISNHNVVTATDLATFTPSLTVNQRFGPEKSSFVIRGFVQENSTAPSVGVYFADVVAPRAQGGTTSGGTAPVGSFMDLENVQVLKGPQGTLFGRNTTGGDVLLVPKKPTDKLEGYVEGSLGNYNMKRIQAVLNVPLADTFKVRLGVDRDKTDGYMKNHSGIGPKDFNDVNYFAARLSIVADLTPDLENYTIATYSHSFAHGYGAHIVACNPNATGGVPGLTGTSACDEIKRANARGDGPLDVDIDNPNALINLRQWQVINTTTWKASDTLTIKNIASYSEIRERANYALDGEDFLVSNSFTGFGIPGLPPLTAGTRYQGILLNPAPAQNNSAQSAFTEELQFQGRTADGRLTWQAGGYYETSRPIGFSAGQTDLFLNCTDPEHAVCTNPVFIGSLSQSNTKANFDTKALFAQATYKLTDQLSLTGGIRYTWDETSVLAENTKLTLPNTERCTDIIHFPSATPGQGMIVADKSQCAVTFKAKSSKPTWLVDLDYKPTQDLLLYAKYARGYRQGGANPTNVAFETWQPEKVDAYEIGAKASFRGSSVRGYFNVAGYYNKFTNQQLVANGVASVPGFNSQPVVNAGKSRIQGVEVDASATLFDSLRFDLGYSYLDTKLLSINNPIPPNPPYLALLPTALVGGPLAFSPKNRITLTGTYTLPLDKSIGEISLGATFTHTDKQGFTQATIYPGRTGPIPPMVASFMPANPDLRNLPATNLVNLNVNWNKVMGQPVDVSFFVTNLTNDIYAVGVGGTYPGFGFENLLYGAPRMWGFRLRYSFGS